MPEADRAKAKVAIFISGGGTNMAALLYASRLPGCPYEIVLVVSNREDAGGLTLARAEGIATFSHPHKGMERAEQRGVRGPEVEDLHVSRRQRLYLWMMHENSPRTARCA